MKRFLLILAVAGAGACNKPTDEECRAAVVNIQRIRSEGATSTTFDIEGEIRRCRGGSSKEAVACAIKAQTKADLDACHFRGAKPASP
ncbi:MAG TPA: hypothetical protein VF469_10700 [Kofleriaceae bacterium]